MDAEEVVAIETYGGCKLRPRGNYLIKGLLRHRNTEVCMRGPQLPAASHNKQVYYFILFIYWLVLKSDALNSSSNKSSRNLPHF